MSQAELLRLIPDAPAALYDILDGSRGQLEPPIRSEIFGPQRFAQHGKSLGETHRAARAMRRSATFFPRLQGNIAALREAHRYIGTQASTGYDISPAAEWLLDNFHLIEAQLKEINEGLPRSYFRSLPVLLDEPLAGLPRVYGVAWAFVAHTDGAFDDDLLMQFLSAYQETRELNLSEVWALPTTLRVVLIENLRRLAERVATNKAAREVANRCYDHIETFTLAALDELLALLNQRGVGRVFLAQMAQRLRHHRTASEPATDVPYLDWLQRALPDLAAAQAQQGVDQAADNLSVSNAVNSLRSIGDADWPEIVAQTSVLMRLMVTSAIFAAEDIATRDQTLHGIERLAKRSGRSELQVAQALLNLMRTHASDNRAMAGYWLQGIGRSALMRELQPSVESKSLWIGSTRRFSLPIYLTSLLLGTFGLVAWMLHRHDIDLVGVSAITSQWLTLIVALLTLFPASEAVVAVINRLISESARPSHLPRLALNNGIPVEHRVLVVIPAMLTSDAEIDALIHRLQLHFLANPEGNAQFALLSDWADADSERAASDDGLLSNARAQVGQLNDRYPVTEGNAQRFLILHRERHFSETEQRWIGWERKRGKLELLVAAMAEASFDAFLNFGEASRVAANTPYIVTLDSDTQLPPGRLRDLVGVAAHPQNQPTLDTSARSVISGYGILQPRVVTPLPSPKNFTLFHWLFAGQCGIDPYSAASSEVYQDVFGEGTFTGKGLLNVQAMHAVLKGRLPQGQILSHDLLEGAIARCAAVTDITIIEDAPTHADVAASRVHRWTRGDWQLLPILLSSLMRSNVYPLRAINRWKMFDNLRRSLVPPMSLALLVIALATSIVSPWAVLVLVFSAFAAGPLMGAVAGLAPSRDDIAKRHFYSQAATDLARALLSGLWHVAQLLNHALLAVDAIVRSLYRMTVSHQLLLQWTTAAAAQASAQTGLTGLVRAHWSLPVVAMLLLSILIIAQTQHLGMAVVMCLLWAGTPIWIWWVSRARTTSDDAELPLNDQAYLDAIARDTWRMFERCVVADDNHLPPDNLQTVPQDMVAHRTSPTNIGMYLLSVACARQFGWIGTQELLSRIEATLATLSTLQRHRGHFMNWYDTQTRSPLLPMYVSTVDSGNLSGHLLTVAQACLELARAPFDLSASRRAISASLLRLAPLVPSWPDLQSTLPKASALAKLLALPDPLIEFHVSADAMAILLSDASDELTTLTGGDAPFQSTEPSALSTPHDSLLWCLADHVATLRSAWQDGQAVAAQREPEATLRLQTLTRELEQIAWQADFGFLYHRKRHLFHIGYRVAEQQLDAGFYDLLASESRLTSVLAVAKGDVPTRHWASLGRPFFAVGSVAGLRSWSGSMFEYLMPTLVLNEPHGSVLSDACHAALREQIAYAATQRVPWGISESAYAGRDETLAYQYAPQGVPRLALRRTPPDELVIAPYATALAALIAPRRACLNFAALEELSARRRYGFIEALDFSPSRHANGEPYAPVVTFMAHHQGMTIVALANVLLGGPAQRWGMANAHIEAVASLLHERSPREVSKLFAPPAAPLQSLQQRAPGLLHEVVAGTLAVEPTHVLSNGRYSVTLRPNGAGVSRWGQTAVSRSRDDALRDSYGSFFYLRSTAEASNSADARLASITQHPAGDPEAHYAATHHADRVCFEARWPELQAHTTVWVSPEDDIEFRKIELRNLSDQVIDIELISAFDVTLTDPRADEAHPAFTNLFVRAEWLAHHQALLFERKPRLATERGLLAAHFLADTDRQVVGVRIQTDRLRWLGRNRATSQPLASFDQPPTLSPELPTDTALTLDTGLDPVCAMAVRIRIAPFAKAELTFATAASDHSSTLRAVIDKYRQPSHVKRASLMSATLTGIRLRTLRITAENHAAIQTLTTAMVLSLTKPRASVDNVPAIKTLVDACDRRLLWRFGMSGDRPIILVTADIIEGLGLLRSLAKALRVWSWGGVACDLVVVNMEPASYQMALHREIAAMRERHVNGSDAETNGTPTVTGFYLLRGDEISNDELSTLQTLARIRINADGRPLTHHVQEWLALHARAFVKRSDATNAGVTTRAVTNEEVRAPVGEFAPQSNEFRFAVETELRPQRPWINVLSNPDFGAQLTETGGGYTWAVNSRMNQLTAWSNDPVADTPSEWFLLQDVKTRKTWSVSPSAWSDETVNYRVAHGQGYSVIRHTRGELEVTATWCVDSKTSVKQVRLRLVNRGHRTQSLRVIGITEWIMGANRADRGSTRTSTHRPELPARNFTALLCTQRERAGGFGEGTAFLSLDNPIDEIGETSEIDDWTCDRRECFNALGQLTVPDRFGQKSGAGLDPCAALSTRVTLAAGVAVERVFLIGYGENPTAARELATRANGKPALDRITQVRSLWDELLGATTVKTPDPLFDAMVNRWLLYQTVSCRMWAKAGFYQAGGATGFRDQLQDSMALVWAAPTMLRDQILLCASRQYAEGDVQHWWHSPGGAGVRTHFSDDLLWLAHACAHYVRATGDAALLDQQVPFIEGIAIPEGAEDAYYTPTVSTDTATVYEHAARAIDRSLRVGIHGLPLMGSGDWNDGMNRVGHEGRGESVWLGWFLCKLVADFAPIARQRGDVARAERWQESATGWNNALLGTAWDGEWFKRAFFDDGQALGSQVNTEAKIDLIAQAWAVLSGAAPADKQRAALKSVETHLVDHDAGLLRLLDPPLANATPSAGYIQAYPPGVRENGGQYSHGAVWALMAQAEFATANPTTIDDSDLPYRYFTYLSPAHRAAQPKYGAVYGVEPYVMAGDTYTHAPYVGRGGWSWYTGAAAWMHRAAIESIFGLQQTAHTLSFKPCLPSHWPQAELMLKRDGRTMRFILIRGSEAEVLQATATWDATLLPVGQSVEWTKFADQIAFVIPLQPA